MILSYSLTHPVDKRPTGFETQIKTLTKIHTLRNDRNKRWRTGRTVNFWMGSPRNKGSYPFYIAMDSHGASTYIPYWEQDNNNMLVPQIYAIEEVFLTRPTKPKFIAVAGQLFSRPVKQWMRVQIGSVHLSQLDAHDFAARDGLGLDRLEAFLFHKTKETTVTLRLLHWTNKIIYDYDKAEIHQPEIAGQ